MAPVSGIGSRPPALQEQPDRASALPSFWVKASGDSDFTSECMALFAEDSGLQMQVSRQGVDLQRRMVREARHKRLELIKKIKEASKDAGFWSGLTDFFSGLTGALVAALSVLGGPTGTVALVGALASGGCGVFKAGYDRQAARAQADKVQVEQFKRNAADLGEEQLGSFERAVQLEHSMTERIRELVDSKPDVFLLQDDGRSHVR